MTTVIWLIGRFQLQTGLSQVEKRKMVGFTGVSIKILIGCGSSLMWERNQKLWPHEKMSRLLLLFQSATH